MPSGNNSQPCTPRANIEPTGTDWRSIVHDPRLRKLMELPSSYDFAKLDTQTKNAIRIYTSDFDMQVTSLERSIEQLTIQRNFLASVSRQLKAFVSPINNLPDDVLLNIVQLCIGAGWTYLTHGHVNLFRLTQVCRRWRKLVIASPLLWSHIDIDWVGFRREDGPYSLAASAFQRARHVPLHVHIDLAESGRLCTAARTGHRRRILGILEESLHRCRRLDINHWTSAGIKALNLWTLPSLEELRLSLWLEDSGLEGTLSIADFPNLTRLYVDGGEFDIRGWADTWGSDRFDIFWCLTGDHPKFPWYQLTTLSWRICAAFSDILKILALTERLETLEIGPLAFDDYDGAPDSAFHVTLAHLKTLNLYWMPEFLWFICCPALEDLSIGVGSQEVLTAFISRSRPPLKVIRVNEDDGDWDGLPDVDVGIIPLEEFMVTELVGPFETLPSSLLNFQDCGVPLTKTLTLNVHHSIDTICTHGSGILSLLRSLRMANCGLQTFKLRGYADYPYSSSWVDPRSESRSRERIRASPFFQGLEAMRSDGLEVIVSHSTSADPHDESSREYY
ncbi:hypothetical protein CYLTODRAFT_119447 [Cylindrobasidium torrendii FP15055 ss-10]|uniref:F-box domain-containing protein n=1 Tax=Cylindrobasidium torrendii FP15055 ss-10 TaxID=1314674 RepID=A0A0D7AZX7_9AGAR|nr:hypothetical protein CYLTODRAFT_119447 [Cylindrobasidium torrendii FP15055 ss-10]